MRKLYALLAWLFISLAGTQINARQTIADLADFTFTVDATSNTVIFTNTSVIGTEPGTRRAYWNFGDGTTQSGGPLDNIKHQYLSAGTYTVCLRLYRFTTNTTNPVLLAERSEERR